MIFWIVILGVLGVLGVRQVVNAQVQKIKANPDPYPLEVLLKEPQGDEITITRDDGTHIRALSAGNGPIVALAHGYGYSFLEWNVIWSKLLKLGYHVITFDQRGHGKSTIGTDGIGSRQMAGDYKAVLEHYDVHDAVLVGHSMGGFLSLVYMLTYPDDARKRLKGCVLFASTAGNVVKGSPQNRIQIPMIRTGIMQKIVESPTYGWLFGMSLYGEKPSPAGIQAFLKGFAEQPHQTLIPIIEALASEDYYARLPEITIPCVTICGEQDKTTPRWHSEHMGKEIPNARSVWVKGKGHLLNWEAPDALIEVVESFKGV